MGSASDQIAAYLADAYGREIDQEETIWRSLPFFAAVLALELNALFIALKYLAPGGAWRRAEVVLLTLDALAILATLCAIAPSILRSNFKYVGRATEMLAYARQLDAYASDEAGGPAQLDAAATLRATLAEEQAKAIDNNGHINRRRLAWRGLAGSLAMVSILVTIALAFTEIAAKVRP